MGCPVEVLRLVERFEREAPSYRSVAYNETNARREFIDPLFKALGWDIDNEAGYAEAYKDVVHEDAIKVGGLTKAPDYCFRIGGARKFFVEAKKPAVNLKDDASPAECKTPYERSSIERALSSTDRMIDDLVYELFGLAQDEIAMIEASCERR